MKMCNNSGNQVKFGASTSEIKAILEKSVSINHASKTICPSKANFLKNTLLPLTEMDSYHKINLNEEIIQSHSDALPVKTLKKWLNSDSIFKCGGGDNCNCGQNMKNKKFLSIIFKQLGLNEPNILEIDSQRGTLPHVGNQG